VGREQTGGSIVPSVAATFKSADQFSEILDALNVCVSEGQIGSVFSYYRIDDTEDKKELLHRCMGIDEYFDSPHTKLSVGDEYSYAVSVFLEGSWRLLVNG
jgi:hypothetical protein